MVDKTIYTEDSIESLDARSHVRLRSGMYAGNTETPNQLLLEAFSNSLDEHNLGHGNKIIVNVNTSTGECGVIDYAQGFPVDVIREDGKSVLEASYSVINTSGKFSDDGVYGGSSLGLNGVGGKVCCFLSTKFQACSSNDGKTQEVVYFEDGVLVNRQINKNLKTHTGTSLRWTPDPQFFTSNIVDVDYFKSFFNDITCLCVGLEVEFNVDDETYIYKHDSFAEIIDLKMGDSIPLFEDMFVVKDDGIDVVLTFTEESSTDFITYVNYGNTTSGPHITKMKTVITKVLNAWARDNGILKAKEKNLDGAAIQEGMLLVANFVSKNVAYDAQTKSNIVKMDTDNITSVFQPQFEAWLDNNPECAKMIVEKAVIAKRAAEAAKKARAAVRAGKQRKVSKPKIMNPDKLKDAERLGQDSILLCVEGNSAAASMAVARDTSKYGILGLRGKIINAFANNEKKVRANEEVQLLFQGLGLEPGEPYDSKKLRYGKIAICVDSDSDGYHIGLLLMVVLQHYFPQFIEEGRLCWLRAPLYAAKRGKSVTFFYSDEEWEAVQKSHKGSEIARFKGLGSLSATQARASMFSDDQQRLDVLDCSPEGVKLLKDLMGKSDAARKEFVFNNIDFSRVRE